jgi:uncharacterized surface protein with fasciclin (FAS1) repeats
LFPVGFSTFELAARKTGLFPPDHPHHKKPHDGEGGDDKAGDDDKDHHGHHGHHFHNTTGLTLFAPSNFAFGKLGAAANAFLFNTRKGLFYLRALLKYHVVVNETLYTDAYYGIPTEEEAGSGGGGGVAAAEEEEGGKGIFANNETYLGFRLTGDFHIDMPTLLADTTLAVDIHRWYTHVSMRVNRRVSIGTPGQDWVAHNGVLQVVHSVLIPPYKHKRGSARWLDDVDGGEIAVEELIERLKPYVDEKELEAFEDGDDEIIEKVEEEEKVKEKGKPHLVPAMHEQSQGNYHFALTFSSQEERIELANDGEL